MIVGSVACAVPGCTAPVIGQCPGLDGRCGRFYCAVHDAGHLCPDCARRRAELALYNRYVAACARATPQWERWLFAVGGGAAAVAAGLLAVRAEEAVAGHALASGGISPTLLTFGLTVTAVIILFALWEVGLVRRRVERLGESLPGFVDFFRAWRRNRQREAVMTTVVVGAAAVLGAVAAGQERVTDPKP